MNKKQKNMLLRIIVSTIMLVALNYYLPEDAPVNSFVRLALYLVPYLIVGHDILQKAFKGIKHGQVFDENFLMAVATLGALCLAVYNTNDYTEAIAVMLFYQTGELFQGYAVGKSRRSIGELMDIRPDTANVEREGTVVCVSLAGSISHYHARYSTLCLSRSKIVTSAHGGAGGL